MVLGVLVVILMNCWLFSLLWFMWIMVGILFIGVVEMNSVVFVSL